MEKNNLLDENNKGKALIPLLVFIGIYLFAGVYFQFKGVEMAFYQFPASIAVIIGIISSFLLFKGSLDDKFNALIAGCGNENIVIMCLIYLLAGAFSGVSSAMGGVDSIVNLGLTLIPVKFIIVGIFLIAAFISLATGTSIGTLVAVAPIGIALVEKAGLNLPLALGALVGGVMFGDNLSIISDTTIAATRTQGVSMKDKFRVNSGFAIPAATLTIILLIVFGRPEIIPEASNYDYNLVKIIPYLFVLTTALMGMNVFVILTSGIALSGIIGIYYGNLTFIGFMNEINAGFSGMFDIFLLSLLTGGLANLVTKAGGVQWILEQINKKINNKKQAELGIGLLAGLSDMATANNTVSIIISGDLSKNISKKYSVDPRRTASLLDAFSCAIQGIIPYGAQLLIAASLTNGAISPVAIIPYVWYSFILLATVVLTIYTNFGKGYIKKNPWNFETEEVIVNEKVS